MEKMALLEKENAIMVTNNDGPIFGGGYDLCIRDKCNLKKSNKSFAKFPWSYVRKLKTKRNDQKEWTKFSGAKLGCDFTVVEYEVFKVFKWFDLTFLNHSRKEKNKFWVSFHLYLKFEYLNIIWIIDHFSSPWDFVYLILFNSWECFFIFKKGLRVLISRFPLFSITFPYILVKLIAFSRDIQIRTFSKNWSFITVATNRFVRVNKFVQSFIFEAKDESLLWCISQESLLLTTPPWNRSVGTKNVFIFCFYKSQCFWNIITSSMKLLSTEGILLPTKDQWNFFGVAQNLINPFYFSFLLSFDQRGIFQQMFNNLFVRFIKLTILVFNVAIWFSSLDEVRFNYWCQFKAFQFLFPFFLLDL